MKERTPFAHVLHADTIAKLAHGAALARGRLYAEQGRVTMLARRRARLVGTVQGTRLYSISIWVKGSRLGYACSCPAGANGDFCKHCVALVIAWLEKQR
jgi:uncharacterized Zn finger protein